MPDCAVSGRRIVRHQCPPIFSVSAVTFPSTKLRQQIMKPAMLVAGLVLLTVAGIRLTDRADARRAVRAGLADGRHFADSLTSSARATSSSQVVFPAAVSLEYLARLQVGLGSPFRLVDLARTDPRLPIAWRPRVANALLARLQGDSLAMRPLPHALRIALATDSGSGAALLRLVDSVMISAGASPLVLESFRIAAAQASAHGLLRSGAVPLLDAAALLAYDRRRAVRDLDRAINASSRGDGDLPQLVASWRRERRFGVERPLLFDVAPSSQRVASRVPALLGAIRAALAVRDTMTTAGSLTASPSPLPANAARALSLLISVRTRPPQPQVRLSALDARAVSYDRSRVQATAANRLLLGATNEETMVMMLASVSGDTALEPIAATAALLVSQGMRTLAQEAPFHPGTLALRPEQVAERLGLGSLTFGRDVPMSWRPFYAREFATAVDAVRDVFPRSSFVGLNVHVGDTVSTGALAVHDPRARRLTLPLATGFGAVGHELMHDLDWQSARDISGRLGTYATDNARRSGANGQPIAARIARLAEFVPAVAVSTAYNTEARRPAELLARGADWFLASALARQGRVNGALSAVQDGWIRGYASAVGPAAFADHAAALSALFDAMPTLAVRAPVAPRSDAEREPDLGTIARAAWFSPIPQEGPAMFGQRKPMIPVTSGKSCSPVARLRLVPMQSTARTIAADFLRPRVERTMRRWAWQADTQGLSPDAALLRLALLGAPVSSEIVESARAAWMAAAWRALPCLTLPERLPPLP